jgi:endonuclease/exonuclease/phosphatase family metal-dependent hydrolase
MTWNVGHGGLDPQTGDDRFWRQVELINRLTPDILCLQEAWQWDENGSARLLVFEHATSLRTFLAPAPSGFHTIIAVRPPMARPLKHLPHHHMTRHGCNTLVVELGTYELPVTIVSAHLTEQDGDTRLHEAAKLVDLAAKPCILAGTLNCAGLDDPPTDLAAVAPILQCRYALPPVPGPGGTIDPSQPPAEDRRAMHRLCSAGFTDAAVTQADTTTPAPSTTGYPEPNYYRRHDHILISGHLVPHITPRNYAVLDTQEIRHLSPHLPVTTTLRTC